MQTVLGHNISHKNKNWSDPNFKALRPDIISDGFIGDAKYYRIENFADNPFDKELYAYNVANGNLEPNFVFIPSEETKHLKTLVHNSYRLEVVAFDLRNILRDYKHKSNETLDFVKSVIDNKYTQPVFNPDYLKN